MKEDKIIDLCTRNLILQGFAVLVMSTVAGRDFGLLSPHTISQVVLLVSCMTVVVIGLLGLRKWAVIYFCLGSVLVAIWLFFESISFVAFPFNLCYMFLAVVFVLSSIDLIRSWSLLSWGGRWFF